MGPGVHHDVKIELGRVQPNIAFVGFVEVALPKGQCFEVPPNETVSVILDARSANDLRMIALVASSWAILVFSISSMRLASASSWLVIDWSGFCPSRNAGCGMSSAGFRYDGSRGGSSAAD